MAHNRKRKLIDKQQTRKAQYGFESGEDLQATGQVVGEKPIVVNADEGANVYVHTNGNGNGHAAVQREFNRRQR